MSDEGTVYAKLDLTNSRGALAICRICKLQPRDIPAIMMLQSAAGTHMYVPLTEQELERYTQADGGCLGAWVGGELIGFRCIAFAELSGEHLGRDLGWPDDRLLQAAHLEATVVHPDFRGNGLQYTLAMIAINQICKPLGYRYLFATVAPSNLASLRTLFKLGMTAERLMLKYGGHWRYIMLLDLQCKHEGNSLEISKLTSVPIHCLEEQAILLELGGKGIRLRHGSEGWELAIAITKLP